MAYSAGIVSFCFLGRCIAIITDHRVQLLFEALVKWLLTLAQNLEFIGVALGASLLLYVELEIRSLDFKGNKKKGAHIVNDFFLLSLSMFLLSAIVDWVTTQPEFPVLYNNVVLSFFEAIVFVFGLFALAIGIGVLRDIGRTGKTTIVLPDLTVLIVLSALVIANSLILVYSLGSWAQMEWIGQSFLVLLILTLPSAVIMIITAWGKNWRRITIAVVLLAIPWAFLIIAALLARPQGAIVI